MKISIKIISTILFAATLNACDSIEDLLPTTPYSPTDARAIVSTVAGDYSASAVSVITGDNSRIAYNELLSSTDSDRTFTTYNNNIYVIEKFNGNNIAKFSSDDITNPVWQYSTQDSVTDSTSSNPQQIIFVSETKAYVLRYGSNNIWIVNPSATTSNDFKIGEIDLSTYADSDGLAEIKMGVIGNGNLYIAMQRLDQNNYFSPTNISYLAVIDTNTNLEIDAGITGDSLLGIPLIIRNPSISIEYLAENNSLYVQGIGTYASDTHTGGVEKVDLTDYSSSLIIDDGEALSHLNEKVSAMTIVSSTIGYYISYISWGQSSLYKFNPTTGVETQTSIASLISGDFSYLTTDSNGLVWLSDVGNATVHVINPISDTLEDSIYTGLNPQEISFVNQ